MITDKSALDQIARVMSENEWNADTADMIARIVLMTGRKIEDLHV